jgi:hypothetical protein
MSDKLSRPAYVPPRPAPGVKLGKLTIISAAPGASKKSWRCQCDCGTTRAIRHDYLVGGQSRSCGCTRAAQKDRDIGAALACKPSGPGRGNSRQGAPA